MKYYFLLFIGLYFIYPIEPTIGPGSRKAPSRTAEKIVSPSTSSDPSPSSPTIPQESLSPTDSNVIQRNLLDENITPQLILDNYQSYCSACADTRQFPNPTLIYITPWNNRGYDLIKIFPQKFDYVCPVWLSLKRTGIETYKIDGTHDIDAKWIETIKEKRSDIRFVPRIIIERWLNDDIRALIDSENEKQNLSLTLKSFLIEHNHLFDGYVLELLSQFQGSPKENIHHIIIDIVEQIHEIETDSNRRKEVFLAVPPVEEYFDQHDFQILSKYVDGFLIMTYDMPTRDPAPVSSIEWIKEVMNRFPLSQCDSFTKVFLGINFYGRRYDRIPPTTPNSAAQSYVKYIIGNDYIEFLKEYFTNTRIIFDNRAHEHITLVYRGALNNPNAQPDILVFYPSLKSIYDRLELATQLHVGAAVWDGGQGLDYFFDLF